jgi:hypothetical protein
MKPFGVIIVVFFLLIFHYVVIAPLLITTADLSKVDGTASSQRLIHVSRPKSSFNAYLIGINGGVPLFGIQDNKDKAFNYLSTHNVGGEHVTVLYDPKGHNEDDNITYHVYSVTVDGYNIMTLNEAKAFYYWGLLVLAFLDGLFYFAYRRAQRKLKEAS